MADDDDFFSDDDYGLDSSSTADPLEEYLNSPPIPSCNDPIQYWSSMLGPRGKESPLACMALDFLSAPGMSLTDSDDCSLS